MEGDFERDFFEKIFITQRVVNISSTFEYPASASLFKGKIFLEAGAWPFVWKYSLISGTR